MKQCSVCKETKSLDSYHKKKNGKYGLDSICKSCRKEYGRKRYLKKGAIIRAMHKKYRDNNKEKESARRKKHRKNNLPMYAANTARRRAAKLQATPKWADHKYIGLFYELSKIEEKRTGKQVHVDHIIPLQSFTVCGLHCEHNLQLMFARDNESKGNRFEPTLTQ